MPKKTIIVLVFALIVSAGCSLKPQETKKPDTLQEAIDVKVNNPLDNAIKLHNIKEKAQEEIGGANKKMNEEMQKALEDN